MIIDFIIFLLWGVVYGLTYPLRILNDVALSADFASAITTANNYIAGLNFVLPVPTLITIIGLFLALEGFIIAYKLINWLIRKIPSIN
jgi:hypothetical protein